MDGVYRPSQALGYTDTIGTRDAVDRALAFARKTKGIHAQDKIASAENNLNRDGNSNSQGEPREDEEQAEKALLAELEKQFNIRLQAHHGYHFVYNREKNVIDIMDALTQQLVLSMAPEAFVEITQKLRYNAGIMTDRSA